MKNLSMILSLMVLTLSLSAYSQGKIGGGGDASEMRVNEIRLDLLKWIEAGGAKGLNFQGNTTLKDYETKMSQILQPKFVVISFVDKDHPSDGDQQVEVDGVAKTCRSFLSERTQRLNILCNISRFEKTSGPDQYRLIHHEYAGLAGIEKNEGAASDYYLSNQITDYLKATTVLRLSVKKVNNSFPEGAILRDYIFQKRMELYFFDEFYKKGLLTEEEFKSWKNLCAVHAAKATSNVSRYFSYQDLELEKDFTLKAEINQRMLQQGEFYYGCKAFLVVEKTGYTSYRKDFEFLNAHNCEEAFDRTKEWLNERQDRNDVYLEKKMIKISRQERRERNLPRKTQACVVSVYGVEKY